LKTRRDLIVLALLAFAWPTLASAQGVSVALRGGPSFPSDTIDGDAGHESVIDWGRGYAVGGALSYTLPSGLFTEAEFSFLHTPAVSENGVPIGGDDEDQLYLGNVGYELGRNAPRRVRPMLGLGIGLVRVRQHQQYLDEDLSIVEDEERFNNFAFQARAAVAIQVAPRADVSVGYRFIRINATTEPKQPGDDIVINLGTKLHHQLELGLRFKF
jgi:opacity protein-like surface antigen